MKAIKLSGFAQKFASDPDPWNTFTSRDEKVKRDAILHALGAGPWGRVLELASGNGSNSRSLAQRSLRLDATDGTREGTALTAAAVHARPRARALLLPLPASLPRSEYDAVVVAELLYYLSARDMNSVAIEIARSLRSSGRLVLAHHQVNFYDFVQPAGRINQRFLASTGCRWRVRTVRICRRWSVISATKV